MTTPFDILRNSCFTIWFLVSNLMHLFIISFHIPLHVSSHIVLIIRRIHCIYTASGSLCVTLLVWPFGTCAPNGHTRRVTQKEPDAVYIQWILLMLSTIWLETCSGIWKDITNKCIRLETRNQIQEGSFQTVWESKNMAGHRTGAEEDTGVCRRDNDTSRSFATCAVPQKMLLSSPDQGRRDMRGMRHVWGQEKCTHVFYGKSSRKQTTWKT